MRKKVLSLLLASVMVVSLAACGGDKTPANGESSSSVQDSSQAGGDNTGVTGATYTYHTYSSALATKWNEHSWDTNADDAIRRYVTSPLVDLTILDS